MRLTLVLLKDTLWGSGDTVGNPFRVLNKAVIQNVRHHPEHGTQHTYRKNEDNLLSHLLCRKGLNVVSGPNQEVFR